MGSYLPSWLQLGWAVVPCMTAPHTTPSTPMPTWDPYPNTGVLTPTLGWRPWDQQFLPGPTVPTFPGLVGPCWQCLPYTTPFLVVPATCNMPGSAIPPPQTCGPALPSCSAWLFCWVRMGFYLLPACAYVTPTLPVPIIRCTFWFCALPAWITLLPSRRDYLGYSPPPRHLPPHPCLPRWDCQQATTPLATHLPLPGMGQLGPELVLGSNNSLDGACGSVGSLPLPPTQIGGGF